jgi:aminobenzoyl-glutamate utilization protein B
MVQAGVFDDLDAAFNFHPIFANLASKGSSLGVNSIRFRFYGRTAHAAGAPHLGRSALDAVELMNVGVNYLREHVVDSVRIHYVITDGGQAPNIVPETAEVYYFIRAPLPEEVAEVTERVQKIAQGAALMTETEFEEIWEGGVCGTLSNHTLADIQFEAMQFVGPIRYDEEDVAFARAMEASYPPETKQGIADAYGVPVELFSEPLMGIILPSLDEGKVLPGSTDVGDMSWRVPLSMLWAACAPVVAVGHSWGITAASAHPIGHKGMMFAAKVMAVAAIDLYTDPDKLKAVREEFESVTGKRQYVTLIPEGVTPPQHKHPYR